MLDNELYRKIATECGCPLEFLSGEQLTTLKCGGNAYVFSPKSEAEFVFVYGALVKCGKKPFILGGGSNTVVADGVCSRPVISSRLMTAIKVNGDEVYAQCGARLSSVTAELRRHGLGGLEFLSGVPATAGGAVRMNAGAFSHQTADYVRKLRVLNVRFAEYGRGADFCIENIEREQLSLSYRQGVNAVVLGTTFRFDKMGAEESVALAKKYAEQRSKKQPKLPSCGSVFKNGKVPSGKLIEDCGLKGTRAGNAVISEMHGNFIVNMGGAKTQDFMTLVDLCEKEVLKKYGVVLEREFVYLK